MRNKKEKRKNHETYLKTSINVILGMITVLGGIVFLLPFLYMISTSLKSTMQTFVFPPEWVPKPIVWKNYVEAWIGYASFTLYLKNTVIITGGCVIGAILSNSLVAFSFARLNWPGRDLWFIVLLATLMLPYQVTLIPVFIIFSKLGWINTFKPLIVPYYFGNAFVIFLLRQFFLTIPTELDDAAKIDGCSTLSIFSRIILPLSKPGLGMVAIFSFIWNWNDFLAPLIYLNKESKFTLALGMLQFQTEYDVYWNHMMAIATLVMLPCIIIFFFCQKLFIKGIVLGGIKG